MSGDREESFDRGIRPRDFVKGVCRRVENGENVAEDGKLCKQGKLYGRMILRGKQKLSTIRMDGVYCILSEEDISLVDVARLLQDISDIDFSGVKPATKCKWILSLCVMRKLLKGTVKSMWKLTRIKREWYRRIL